MIHIWERADSCCVTKVRRSKNWTAFAFMWYVRFDANSPSFDAGQLSTFIPEIRIKTSGLTEMASRTDRIRWWKVLWI